MLKLISIITPILIVSSLTSVSAAVVMSFFGKMSPSPYQELVVFFRELSELTYVLALMAIVGLIHLRLFKGTSVGRKVVALLAVCILSFFTFYFFFINTNWMRSFY